jgi:hypothetical protein
MPEHSEPSLLVFRGEDKSKVKENIEKTYSEKFLSYDGVRKFMFVEKLQGQRSHGISGKSPRMQPGTPRVRV